jgi:hypothetical protein
MEPNPSQNEFITKNLSVAAWLEMSGLKINRVEPNDRFSYFYFNDKPACLSKLQEYNTATVTINLREFEEKVRAVRAMAYEQRDNGGIR